MEFTTNNYLPSLTTEAWDKTNFIVLPSTIGYCIKAIKTSATPESYASISLPFTSMDTGEGFVSAIKFKNIFSVSQSGSRVSQILDTRSYAYAKIDVTYKKMEGTEEVFFDDSHYIPYLPDIDDSKPETVTEDGEQIIVSTYTAERELQLRPSVIPISIWITLVAIKTPVDKTVTVHIFNPELYRAKTVSEQSGGTLGEVTGISITTSGVSGYYIDTLGNEQQTFELMSGTGWASMANLELLPLVITTYANESSGGRLTIGTTGRMEDGGSYQWPMEGIIFDAYHPTSGNNLGYGAYITMKQSSYNALPNLNIWSRGTTNIEDSIISIKTVPGSSTDSTYVFFDMCNPDSGGDHSLESDVNFYFKSKTSAADSRSDAYLEAGAITLRAVNMSARYSDFNNEIPDDENSISILGNILLGGPVEISGNLDLSSSDVTFGNDIYSWSEYGSTFHDILKIQRLRILSVGDNMDLDLYPERLNSFTFVLVRQSTGKFELYLEPISNELNILGPSGFGYKIWGN